MTRERLPESPSPLDSEKAFSLLRLGLGKTGRTTDELLNRLRKDDGWAWFLEVLSAIPAVRATEETVEDLFLRGSASPVLLTVIKNESKHTSDSKRQRSAALAGYFAASAAALAHYQALISSGEPAKLRSILLDLGGLAPDPWQGLFVDAVRKLSRIQANRAPGENP